MSRSQPKDSSRIRGDARRRKEQKREEAKDRQLLRDVLSPEDQLARLEGRRGESKRERGNLLRVIEARGKVTKIPAKNKAKK